MIEVSRGHNFGFPVWLSGVVFVWCQREEVKRGVQEMGSSAGGKNCANPLCFFRIHFYEHFIRAETVEMKLLSYQVGRGW